MKKRLSYLFFALLFAISAWFGFGLTGQLTRLVTDDVAQAAPVNQSNILIIGLDGAQGNPRVSSVWAALARGGEQSSLIFKKIYPDVNNAADWKEIREGFLPLTGNKLPLELEQRLSNLHISFTGSLLVERSILPGLNLQPGLKSLKYNRPYPLAGSGIFSESDTFAALCKMLTSSASRQQPSGAGLPHWMDPWKGLVTSLRFTSCSVLVDP
jgi:hypothetical protein